MDGFGDLDKKVLIGIGIATSNVIHATGGAIKDTTTGVVNIFHSFSGIGTILMWILLPLVVLYLMCTRFPHPCMKQLLPRDIFAPVAPQSSTNNAPLSVTCLPQAEVLEMHSLINDDPPVHLKSLVSSTCLHDETHVSHIFILL